MENEMTLVAPLQASKLHLLETPRTMTAGARAKSLSPQDIGERAYQKWEAAGKPIGKDLKFWLEAQRELSRAKQQWPQTIDFQPN
jgi:hypothetical protein